jgi:hypothetical protein
VGSIASGRCNRTITRSARSSKAAIRTSKGSEPEGSQPFDVEGTRAAAGGGAGADPAGRATPLAALSTAWSAVALARSARGGAVCLLGRLEAGGADLEHRFFGRAGGRDRDIDPPFASSATVAGARPGWIRQSSVESRAESSIAANVDTAK